MSLSTDSIRFPHQDAELRIDVRRSLEAEVVCIAERAEGLEAGKAGMRRATLQPQCGAKIVAERSAAREADPRLNDDPGLLRINGDRAAAPGEANERVEDITNLLRLAQEIVGEAISTTGVPEICRDEAMTATRALPQGASGLLSHRR